MQRDKTENWGPERESHTLPPVSGLSEALAERAAPGRAEAATNSVWPVCPPRKQGIVPAPPNHWERKQGSFEASVEDERKNRIKTGGAQAASGRITAVRSAGCFKGFHGAVKWGQKYGDGITRVCSGGQGCVIK